MQNFIYPLTWEEFESLHREAWHNGWTYGPAFPELYEDYLVNWVYFVDYVDVLINVRNNSHKRQYERIDADIVHIPLENGQVLLRHVPDAYEDAFKLLSNVEAKTGALKIFIGEAPPFWAGNSTKEKRTYFYHPEHTSPSTWLNAPYKYFRYLQNPCESSKVSKITFHDNELNFINNHGIKKIEKLEFLACEGVVLLDIFPFPIWQATKIRETITADFSSHLINYFSKLYKSLKGYINSKIATKYKNVEYKYALATPILTGLQILYGSKSKEVFRNIVYGDSPLEIVNLTSSSTARTMYVIKTYYKKKFNKKNAFESFFSKIAFNKGTTVNLLPFQESCPNMNTPILMDESGNVNFTKFFNSNDKYLTIKINSKETESKDND